MNTHLDPCICCGDPLPEILPDGYEHTHYDADLEGIVCPECKIHLLSADHWVKRDRRNRIGNCNKRFDKFEYRKLA
jgi:hypothetical protein